MRKALYWLSFSTCLVAVLLCAPLTGNSQNREKFVISAKAGGINAVTGRAIVHGRGTSEWQQLTIKEDLVAGDVVKTGLDGRVEMLLNPGSYLRIGEDSEFELSDNSLDNLEVRLVRGTAIVEATGAEDTELSINIITPDTRMAIVRRGLYRVNVVPGDSTELIVRKGRVMLGDSHQKIKGGNKVIFSGGVVSVAKLQNEEKDKKNFDNLDTWSKERADFVAKANSKFRNRDMHTMMMGVSDDWWAGNFSGRGFRRAGIWMYNPRYSCYTFVPMYLGWSSPYGSSYSNSFYGNSYWGYGYGGGFGGHRGGGSVGGGAAASNPGAGNGGNMPPPPQISPSPMAGPREIPAAAGRKIDRLANPLN